MGIGIMAFHVYRNSYIFFKMPWSYTCTVLVEYSYLLIYVVFLHAIYLVFFIRYRYTTILYVTYLLWHAQECFATKVGEWFQPSSSL